MSALTPHIKALRAEAEALQVEADEVRNQLPDHPNGSILQRLANAKRGAAERLEAEDQELIARFKTGERPL